jgi:hypothetical protein
MKSLEGRIVRLERARQPETRQGMLWEELCFCVAIPTIWPDLKTAPKFIQAEYHNLKGRLDACEARFRKDGTS